MYPNSFDYRATFFAGCLTALLPFSAFSQEMIYISTTSGEETRQEISRVLKGPSQTIEIQEPHQYSQHLFCPRGSTETWTHRNDKENTQFVAKRQEDNTIHIEGTFKGEKFQKTVSIDEDAWINKMDFGLSQFAMSEEKSMTFWTLKLVDLEPIHFRAEKVGAELLQVKQQKVEAIKIKVTLKNFILSKLWSANLWYRSSDGLFLKYEGAKGRPGTPVTTIEIREGI